jgi:acyl-lipid omega-6 desaturase (Delta-12 desaturase)
MSEGTKSARRQLVERIRPVRATGSLRPALMLAADLLIYGALFTAVLFAGPWWAKLALALGAGVSIARLFLIGHDACHGAYFPGPRWANTFAGRLVFLPSLTPYSTWELGHNTLHHGFTNLKGKDYVYTPFSPAEFAALPKWRRWLERVYRHPLGPGLHYGIEVWWKRLWFPRRAGRWIYQADSLLTLTFLALQCLIVVEVARTTGQQPLALAAWSVALPFVVWNGLMGFVTYQQHTHPSITWYAERRDWDPVTAQVHGTVHVQFPPLIGALLGNIMEHTAHHLDVAIPMFELPEAQRRVEEEFPGEVVVVQWSLAYYLDCCRKCKLYQYDRRQWTDFAGLPTTLSP